MKKWNRYIMKERDDVKVFWSSYYKSPYNRKVLFVMGKGFDPRMNNNIAWFTDSVKELNMECLLLDFSSSNTPRYGSLIYDNINQLKALSLDKGFCINEFNADFSKQWENGIRILCTRLKELNYNDIDDIIVDISSIPRSIYFSILRILYDIVKDGEKNLFVVVSENVEMDNAIRKINHNEASTIWGFRSKFERLSRMDVVKVSLPILGENNDEKLRHVHNVFLPNETYVILPFPSRNPRRSDFILADYSKLFSEELELKEQNIVYAHEQNPFELYRILCQLIENYKQTFEPLDVDICYGISALSSKLLSLGALLVALEYPDEVAIYNVSSGDYTIDSDIELFIEMNRKSESFLIWIDGEAYRE